MNKKVNKPEEEYDNLNHTVLNSKQKLVDNTYFVYLK